MFFRSEESLKGGRGDEEGRGSRRERKAIAAAKNLDDNATVTSSTAEATASKASAAAAATDATNADIRRSTGKSDIGDTAQNGSVAAADVVDIVVVMGVAAAVARDSTSAANPAAPTSPMMAGQRHHGELIPMRRSALVGILAAFSQRERVGPPSRGPPSGRPGGNRFREAIFKRQHEGANKRRAEPQ